MGISGNPCIFSKFHRQRSNKSQPPTTNTRKYGFATRQLHTGQAADPPPAHAPCRFTNRPRYQFRDTDHAARPVRAAGVRQYLLPHHDSHHGCLRAAPRGTWKADRRRWGPAPGMPRRRRLVLIILPGGRTVSVAGAALYGGTSGPGFATPSPRLGMMSTFVDPSGIRTPLPPRVRPNTKSFGETLGDPTDFGLSRSTRWPPSRRTNHIPLVIDNTFATPYLCRPFEWGSGYRRPIPPPSSSAGTAPPSAA